MPADAVGNIAFLSTNPFLKYTMPAVAEVGIMTGSVVPTAISGFTCKTSRIAGVDNSAPPIPNMPDKIPVKNPMSTVKKVVIGV